MVCGGEIDSLGAERILKSNRLGNTAVYNSMHGIATVLIVATHVLETIIFVLTASSSYGTTKEHCRIYIPWKISVSMEL